MFNYRYYRIIPSSLTLLPIGTFSEIIETEFAWITHRMYPHQHFTALFVSDITLEAKSDFSASGTIFVDYPATIDQSPDLELSEPEIYEGNW